MRAVERVVEALRDVEERRVAFDDEPPHVDAAAAREREQRLEHLGDAAADGGRADVPDVIRAVAVVEVAVHRFVVQRIAARIIRRVGAPVSGKLRSEIGILRNPLQNAICGVQTEAQEIVRLVTSAENELVLVSRLGAGSDLGDGRVLNAAAVDRAGRATRDGIPIGVERSAVAIDRVARPRGAGRCIGLTSFPEVPIWLAGQTTGLGALYPPHVRRGLAVVDDRQLQT